MVQDLILIQNFFFTDGCLGKKGIIFGTNMNSYLHVDKNNKYILSIQEGWDYKKLTA